MCVVGTASPAEGSFVWHSSALQRNHHKTVHEGSDRENGNPVSW